MSSMELIKQNGAPTMRREPPELIIKFARPIYVNGYGFQAADDADARDPGQWTLYFQIPNDCPKPFGHLNAENEFTVDGQVDQWPIPERHSVQKYMMPEKIWTNQVRVVLKRDFEGYDAEASKATNGMEKEMFQIANFLLFT